MELVGTVLDGKFQIEKALASGASGDVYEALHLALGARVAVKVLRPGIPETADIRRKRFLREARVAARIRSDHVVRVFDIVAPEHGPTYIVMELLHGETLADRVRRLGPLPVAEAVELIVQAARPLGHMHAEGIVHRDVKPSNLFLAQDADGKERIKLLDFGVAAFRQPVARGESSLTWSEAVIGTPRYMAPEQASSSSNVDARADVWALGVTLYELLAGTPPFDGQTVLAVLNQIEHQEPVPLAQRRPGVPAEIVAVVHRCLAKDPDARPADARALVEALAPSAPDVAVSAPVAAAEGAHRRWPVWAAGAAVLALVGGAVVLAGTRTDAAPVASPGPTPPGASPAAPASAPAAGAAARVDPPAVSAVPAAPAVPAAEPPAPAPPVPARPAVRRGTTRPAPARAPARPSPAVGSLPDDDRIE